MSRISIIAFVTVVTGVVKIWLTLRVCLFLHSSGSAVATLALLVLCAQHRPSSGPAEFDDTFFPASTLKGGNPFGEIFCKQIVD